MLLHKGGKVIVVGNLGGRRRCGCRGCRGCRRRVRGGERCQGEGGGAEDHGEGVMGWLHDHVQGNYALFLCKANKSGYFRQVKSLVMTQPRAVAGL